MSRESDANDVRIRALATLEEARSKLHAWRFLQALKGTDDNTRAAAAQVMLDVAMARQTLSGAILADIVDELEQQDAALKQATAAMDRAVKNLDKVKSVIDAIGKVLDVVGKIVALV